MKVAQSVKILPEHVITDSEITKELEKRRLGPASHDPIFKLTEKRLDVGVMKMQEDYYIPTDSNDWKEGFKTELYPEKPRPNKLVFKYMPPSEVKPKEEQGRWVFYDVDLDAVRAELAQDVFIAGRMEPKAFK